MNQSIAISVVLIVAVWSVKAAQISASMLLIANKSDDTVSFVDLASQKVLATTTTGRGPHEIAVSPQGRLAFVSNYEGAGDSISVIDIPSMKELKRLPLGDYRAPHGIVVAADGKTLLATCEKNQTVIELSIPTEKITRTFRTGQEVTHMIVLTPDGRKAYTANIGSGNCTVIDLEKGEVTTQIQTGAGCEGLDLTTDGKLVWTSNREADTLSMIDTATDRVLETIPCKGFPIRVKISPDNRLALVSGYRSNDIAVFDVKRRQEITRIPTGTAPVGIVIDPQGQRAYVANTEAHTVTILDLVALNIVGQIKAGRTPDGMALVRRN
jgi:YVTN family beta-propeller protein